MNGLKKEERKMKQGIREKNRLALRSRWSFKLLRSNFLKNKRCLSSSSTVILLVVVETEISVGLMNLACAV